MYTLPHLSLSAPAWLVIAWLSGVLLLLARAATSLLRLRRALRSSRLLRDADVAQDLAALAAQARIAPPRLLALEALPGPIAAHGRRIVLPAWALATLDRAQLRAMLAHELAHVARRDPEWKLAVVVWRALFWFVPLNVLAQRRLDEIAELACDAHAAQVPGNAHGLAECLAVCAEQHVRRSDLALATAMAARPSSLVFRIERLLEGVSMDVSRSGMRARGLALVALVACAVALPSIGFGPGVAHAAPPPVPAVPPIPPAPAAPAVPAVSKRDGHSSISIHSDDDGANSSMTVSFSDDAHKFRASVEGKVEFNDEENDIVSLGAGGTARLQETRGGVTQRIELSSRGDKIERRYFVNDAEHPYDDRARALMQQSVKELVRTGMDAEARVKRFYARGGAGAVLQEIEEIQSDYVRGLYLGVLSGIAKLSPAELDRAVALAGAMQSDYERRQAMSALFAKQSLDAARQVTFLKHLVKFSSDYERAELLIEVLPRLAEGQAVRQAWLDAALGVQSDYERRRTLTEMLTKGGLDDAQLGSVIQASASMNSDYEHRELLVAAARLIRDADAVAPSYTHSTQNIHSDYERREALLALIHAGKLGVKGSDAVLDSAAGIKSDYECREVLVALARVMPQDSTVTAHYRSVSARLSEYERGEADRALAR